MWSAISTIINSALKAIAVMYGEVNGTTESERALKDLEQKKESAVNTVNNGNEAEVNALFAR